MFAAKYTLAGVAEWVKGFGGLNVSENGYSIAVDSTGVYVAGRYQSPPPAGVLDLGNGVTLPVSSFSGDSFLVRYNLAGVAQWATSIGGGGSVCYAVAADSTGVYVTGRYGISSNLGNGVTLPGAELGTSGVLFVVKYNSSGVAQWAKTSTGQNSNTIGLAIVVDSTSVYVTGSYVSTPGINLGSGVTLPTTSGQQDAFVVKYTLAGVTQWATTIVGTSSDAGNGITVDSTGVYVTGNYTSISTVSLGNSVTLPISVGSQDLFVIKYDLAGVAQWAKAIGSTGTDIGHGIAVDSTGVYVTGIKSTSTSINLGNGVTIVTSGGCIVKYDLAGVAQWAKGGVGTSGSGISVSSTGVYVTGYYQSSSFSLGNGVTLPTPTAFRNGFVVKYDLTGVAQWAKTVKGTGSGEVHRIVVDSTNVYVSGYYSSSSAVIL